VRTIGRTRAERTIGNYAKILIFMGLVVLPRPSGIQHAGYLGLQACRHERCKDGIALSAFFRSEGQHDAEAPITPFHRCEMSMGSGNCLVPRLGSGRVVRLGIYAD